MPHQDIEYFHHPRKFPRTHAWSTPEVPSRDNCHFDLFHHGSVWPVLEWSINGNIGYYLSVSSFIHTICFWWSYLLLHTLVVCSFLFFPLLSSSVSYDYTRYVHPFSCWGVRLLPDWDCDKQSCCEHFCTSLFVDMYFLLFWVMKCNDWVTPVGIC